MKSEIKDICSADVLDIQNYHPEDPTCFGFWITLIVGIQGTDSGESFQLWSHILSRVKVQLFTSTFTAHKTMS